MQCTVGRLGRKTGSLFYIVFLLQEQQTVYFSPMRRFFKNTSQMSQLDYRLASIPLPDSSKTTSCALSQKKMAYGFLAEPVGRALAKDESMDRSLFYKTLSMVNLAPDIVEEIMSDPPAFDFSVKKNLLPSSARRLERAEEVPGAAEEELCEARGLMGEFIGALRWWWLGVMCCRGGWENNKCHTSHSVLKVLTNDST
jgi:hypothetical protein